MEQNPIFGAAHFQRNGMTKIIFVKIYHGF